MITASTFAASHVLNKAPILPGFSGASATTISGKDVENSKDSRVFTLDLASAITPSVDPRKPIFHI